jgi:protein-S-isoprenylcysteine O-methyltransferase Ste14
MSRGYQLAVRAFGSGWFLLLAILVLEGIAKSFPLHSLPQLGLHGWADLVSRSFIVAYWLILWVLILFRSTPVAQSDGVLPSAMAFLGTYLPLSFPALASRTSVLPLQIASSVLLLLGGTLTMVVLLHLGRCFSLVPQARRVVSGGPYRLIRHPLYVAEEISVCGVVLHFFSVWTVTLLFVHCAIQVRRMLYEESVLMRTFPDYRSYAASKARVIPGCW